MPIWDFRCDHCGLEKEILCKWEDKPVCSQCSKELKRKVSMPAKTPGRWGDSSGGYNHSLGRYFNNSRERDDWAAKNGFVSLTDMGGDSYLDSKLSAEIDSHIQHKKDIETIMGAEDKGEAVAKVFSVERLERDGLLKKE